jgi:hypothetical protein
MENDKFLEFLAIAGGFATIAIMLQKKTVTITGSLVGIVTDAFNTPLSGATVNLSGKTTATNSNGQYSFSNLDLGEYSISFSLTGYDTVNTSVNIIGATSLNQSLNLTSVVPPANNGTLDFRSVPPGASVSVNGINKGVTPFTLSEPPANYAIVITLTGYQEYDDTAAVTANQTTVINPTLSVIPPSGNNPIFPAPGTVGDGNMWYWCILFSSNVQGWADYSDVHYSGSFSPTVLSGPYPSGATH